MKLIIEDDEGRRTVVPLFRDELAIGRGEGNLVRLTEKDVSRRHAKLLRRGGRFYLEDLSTFQSIRVNGDPIRGPHPIGEGDLIEISRYDLVLQGSPGEKQDSGARREDITAKVGRPLGRTRGRGPRIATFVVALLVASALAAALWLRAARGAVTHPTSGASAATTAGAITNAEYDKRASGGSVPPESR
jgi:pSer/pThr/pTyr-binding forkhead associated (FHA) protein